MGPGEGKICQSNVGEYVNQCNNYVRHYEDASEI